MPLGLLRPVGEPTPLKVDSEAEFSFARHQVVFVQSGTAALALALQHATRETGRASGRVLLPGYTCPDVVAAVVHAGLEPVVIDLDADRSFMDLSILERTADRRTCAIVAVSFLGIRERLDRIQEIADSCGAMLIEDSAQGLLESESAFRAPLTVLSFGRGKPASLLGGGALIRRDDRSVAGDPVDARQLPRDVCSRIGFAARAVVTDRLARPVPYRLLSAIPALGIGETRYDALKDIRLLDPVRGRRIATAVRRRAQGVDIAEQLENSGVLSRLGERRVDLPKVVPRRESPLLRYPLLCADANDRDRLIRLGRRAGLDISRFYGRALVDLDAMPPLQAPEPTDRSRQFAERLVTLPTHAGVTRRWFERMVGVLDDWLAPNASRDISQ